MDFDVPPPKRTAVLHRSSALLRSGTDVEEPSFATNPMAVYDLPTRSLLLAL